MKQNKSLLFITWDGPYVNYLEGLFIPILERLKGDYAIHIIQFSWSDEARKERLIRIASLKGITYVHRTVLMKPHMVVGKLISLWWGAFYLWRYIKKNRIQVVMPRSTMPARMILIVRYFKKDFRLIFDADGLPIEERVEFAGLQPNSMRYKHLKRTERKILFLSDAVLTRSKKAAEYLSRQHEVDILKFQVVSNGRDADVFKRSSQYAIEEMRHRLNIPLHAFVLVYVGSLGPQYGVEQMIYLHNGVSQVYSDCYLILVATNPQYLQTSRVKIGANVQVVSAAFSEIPSYLSAADVGLAIRKSSPAMMGVAPVKLGEYLLMGLPVIASAGIGDTEELLQQSACVYILKDYSQGNLEEAVQWMVAIREAGDYHALRAQARMLGEANFSLDSSVEKYKLALHID